MGLFNRKKKIVVLDTAELPDGWTVDRFIDAYTYKNVIVVDSSKSTGKPLTTKITEV